MTRQAIKSFRGEHAFLSNFYVHPVHWLGRGFRSAEHAFQAAKSYTAEGRSWVAAAATPAIAKRRGRTVVLRQGWDSMRLPTMKSVLVAKFLDPELAGKLRATGDSLLVEGNTWGDTYWGECQGEGENHLGKLLMEVRGTLE